MEGDDENIYLRLFQVGQILGYTNPGSAGDQWPTCDG